MALLAGFPAIAAGVSSAPAPGPDPGEALYRVGRQLLSEGKIEPALRKFDEAVTASPRGPFADDALLASASVEYAASSLDDLGRADPGKIERAKARLVKIASEYRGSDCAPQASFRLGLLEMDSSNPRADLDESFATFLQVTRLYPAAPEAAEALYAAGECHRLQGALAACASDDASIVLEHAGSPVAGRARLRLSEGAAILGETALARVLLASMADDQPFGASPAAPSVPPASALARRASDLDALVVRAAADSPRSPSGRTFDGSLPGAGKPLEVASLAVDPEGALWLLDKASGTVLTIPPGEDGPPPAAGPSAEGARGLVVDGRGGVILWDERGMVIPGGKRFEPRSPSEKGAEPEPLKRIGGIASGPFGEIDLIDSSGNRLLRYGPDLGLPRILARFEARPTALVRWQGSLLVLLASRREIVVVPVTSAPAQSTIPLRGPGWEIDSPEAIATDALGRIYVLDGSARSVTVLDGRGGRVALLAPTKGSAWEFRSPTALAVDGSGRIYVADKRLGRILRFR